MGSPQRSPSTDASLVFAAIGILTGLSFLAHLGVVAALPSPATFQEVAAYQGHQTVYVLLLISILVFNAFAVVFCFGLGRFIGSSGPVAAGAASVLAAGVLVTGLGVVLSVGALSALAQLPSDPTHSASAAFEGAFWANLQGSTNSFGNGLMGLGLVLLGSVAWQTAVVPRWLAIVALLGGAGGIVAVVADPLSIVNYGALTIWGFAVGTILMMRSRVSSH